MKTNNILLVALMLLTYSLMAQVELVKETEITKEALYFWYPNGRDATAYGSTISPHGDCFTVSNGYIFFGWYKGGMSNRKLMLSRKKIGSDKWTHVEFDHRNRLISRPGDRSPNAPAVLGNTHQTITVAVSKKDQRVHIFYDHHNDPLNYIVSKKNIAFGSDSNFKRSNFEGTRNTLAPKEKLVITYPEVNRNDNGDLILNYRKGNSHGGSEFIHVYNGTSWTRSQIALQGFKGSIKPKDQNYAYGETTYGNGSFYYSFSVRWDKNKALNEGVYAAQAGDRMTGKWKPIIGVDKEYSLPIKDYSPFLIDMPKTEGNLGSSSTAQMAVTENGDMQIGYKGSRKNSKYFYTYTRKAGDRNFKKHIGVYIDAKASGNKFYATSISGNKIVIKSNKPGLVKQTVEAEIRTDYNLGKFVEFIDNGILYIIVDVRANSDKHEVRCYEFKLGSGTIDPVPTSTPEPTEESNDLVEGTYYRFKNAYTKRYMDGEKNYLKTGSSTRGFDKQWRFVKSGSYYNIESRKVSGEGRGILRAGPNRSLIGTNFVAPRADLDKQWIVTKTNDGAYRIKSRLTNKYIQNDRSHDVSLTDRITNRSKWFLEDPRASKKALGKSNAQEFGYAGVKIFPNPANNNFNITLQGFDEAQIFITDLLGKHIYQNVITHGHIEVTRDGRFTSGMYLIKVIGGEQEIFNEKLFIE